MDEQAKINSYAEYAHYGRSTFQAVRSQTETAKRYRYTGKEKDEESGLYYHGARYYSTWLGRWTTTDPAGLKDSICLFEYVHCNPARFFDPDGRQTDSTQDMMMGMMWRQMGQEIEAMIEGVFGGSAYVDPASNCVEYSGPRNGVGGVVGGPIREASFRMIPIEDNPTSSSLVGLEVGAGLTPVFGPLNRLVSRTTTTGIQTSRTRAAIEFALDVTPFVLEARAATIEARMAAAGAAEVDTSVSLAFRPGFQASPPRPIGHNMVGVNTGGGTEWSHLVVGEPRTTSGVVTAGDAFVVPGRAPNPAQYVVLEMPVTAAEAQRAAAAAQAQLSRKAVGPYGLFQQDCTTYAGNVMQSAGLATPRFSTPALNAASAALHTPAAIAPLRTLAGASVATSTGLKTTALEEARLMSIPSEHLRSE